MNYTIKGKEYAEFDINKRCAEIYVSQEDSGSDFDKFTLHTLLDCPPCYTTNPSDTWPIIEKCWDELHKTFVDHSHKTSESFKEIDFGKIITKWQSIIIEHNCSPLVAACICFIEINERK